MGRSEGSGGMLVRQTRGEGYSPLRPHLRGANNPGEVGASGGSQPSKNIETQTSSSDRETAESFHQEALHSSASDSSSGFDVFYMGNGLSASQASRDQISDQEKTQRSSMAKFHRSRRPRPNRIIPRHHRGAAGDKGLVKLPPPHQSAGSMVQEGLT
jgi:hypothetical protein